MGMSVGSAGKLATRRPLAPALSAARALASKEHPPRATSTTAPSGTEPSGTDLLLLGDEDDPAPPNPSNPSNPQPVPLSRTSGPAKSSGQGRGRRRRPNSAVRIGKAIISSEPLVVLRVVHAVQVPSRDVDTTEAAASWLRQTRGCSCAEATAAAVTGGATAATVVSAQRSQSCVRAPFVELLWTGSRCPLAHRLRWR